MKVPKIQARFDDLTPGGGSFRLVGPTDVLEATSPDEVPHAIAAAEAAAANGSWVAGIVSYEAAPGLDPALAVRTPVPGDPFAAFPLAWFGVFADREATALPEPSGAGPATWLPTSDRAAYDAALSAIHGSIAAGDTYQVNHSIRLRSDGVGDERLLYRHLCYAQRGAYGAYVDLGRYRVLSASPELFFRIDDDRLTTRPMKGTAPRGRWAAEDDHVRARLTGSVKDRAENAMIVDLLRNDLGRVARPGSVAWSNVFEPERYETVWQLTSTVSCELRPGTGVLEVFRALFPSGSVTGAPKVATMGIIARLEDRPRGVYCGAIGVMAPHRSDATFNVAIRTVAVDSDSGIAEYGVGGGITWDSTTSAEFDEVIAKARILTDRRPFFELIETMRVDPGQPIQNLWRHLERLLASAAYFGFDADEERIRSALVAALPDPVARPSRVRLSLDRRGRCRIGVAAIPSSPETTRVALDLEAPVDPADAMLFHKTSLRRRYEEARARYPDVEDVVLTNVRGEVTESTIANVAVRIGGTWWTPPLDCGLLPGIGRAVLLDQGSLRERVVTVEDLRSADEVALVSDARGWRRAELTYEPS